MEKKQLTRGDSISVELPPGVAYVVDLSLKEARPLPKRLPDLAISEADVALGDKGGHVMLTVHNVGLAPAENVKVRVVDVETDETMGEQLIPLIEAPLDLEPRIMYLQFEKVDTAPSRAVRVTVDPDNEIVESDERNNEAAVAF